jgi:uncharacterized membrane protein YphA (DoxX/SURF4 family)
MHKLSKDTRGFDSLRSVWWVLRIAFGLVPLLAGLDKFVGLLANWEAYLSPAAVALLPVSASVFMKIVGVVEVVVGLMVLTKLVRVGALVAMVWLVLIAANLMAAGYLDIAVRDLVMAAGAWSLARLDAILHHQPERATHRDVVARHAATAER